MVTTNGRGAYDWLWQAMQQKALQGQGKIFSTPKGTPRFDYDAYDTPQAGLLGRLIALQTAQRNSENNSPIARPTLFDARDPNFRQLSRVANQTLDANDASDKQEYVSGVRRGQSTISDVPRESINSGAQDDQGSGNPSFEEPGSSFDGDPSHDAVMPLIAPELGEDVSGATSGDASYGATQFGNKRKRWLRLTKARKDDSPSMRRNRQKWRTDALIRDIIGKAITSSSGADLGDPCDIRYNEEEKRCNDNWLGVARRLCIANAKTRRDLCKTNGGKPDPNEKPKWSPEQEQ